MSSMDDALRKSSLGTPEAELIAETVSDETAYEIFRRSQLPDSPSSVTMPAAVVKPKLARSSFVLASAHAASQQSARFTPREPTSDIVQSTCGIEQTQPTFSWSQAKQGGLTTHKIFMLVGQIWIAVVDYHRWARTPRDQWEPTEVAGHLLGAHYNREATEQVEKACTEELDPPIRNIEDMGTEIETTVRALTDRDPKLTSSETGIVYTETEAVTQVERNQAKIDADVKRGQTHHKRVPAWVRVLGKIMPYGEALGLVVLLTFCSTSSGPGRGQTR